LKKQDGAPLALYWTTDRAVDRLDVEHMGRALRRRGRSDRGTALEVFRYMRRTMFHYPMRNENHADQFDAAKLVNVYGYSFCTQQGVAAAALARAAGLRSRSIGIPGHGMYEVHYDGRWHAFCTEFAFYVFTRGADRHIASMAELKADPSLITAARREGRVPEPFLPCAGGKPVLREREGTEACPYSLTCRYYDEAFFARGVAEWRSQGPANPSKYSAWAELRSGESLRLNWDAAGRFVPPSDLPRSRLLAKRFWPPRHICGSKDGANPFFPEIRPYARKIGGRTTYRYYGSGTHVWKPRVKAPGALGELARAENLSASRGGLRPLDGTGPATAEFEMSGPYPYVGGTVEMTARIKPGGRLALAVQGGSPRGPWHRLRPRASGRGRLKAELGGSVLPEPSGRKNEFTRYRFRLRVTVTGPVTLAGLEIRGEVQHNWAALPQLMPGRNLVSVRGRRTGAPRRGASRPAAPLFELAWKEGARRRRLRMRPAGGNGSRAVRVGTAVPPRMLYVLLKRD
jgi:hypothetical protein